MIKIILTMVGAFALCVHAKRITPVVPGMLNPVYVFPLRLNGSDGWIFGDCTETNSVGNNTIKFLSEDLSTITVLYTVPHESYAFTAATYDPDRGYYFYAMVPEIGTPRTGVIYHTRDGIAFSAANISTANPTQSFTVTKDIAIYNAGGEQWYATSGNEWLQHNFVWKYPYFFPVNGSMYAFTTEGFYEYVGNIFSWKQNAAWTVPNQNQLTMAAFSPCAPSDCYMFATRDDFGNLAIYVTADLVTWGNVYVPSQTFYSFSGSLQLMSPLVFTGAALLAIDTGATGIHPGIYMYQSSSPVSGTFVQQSLDNVYVSTFMSWASNMPGKALFLNTALFVTGTDTGSSFQFDAPYNGPQDGLNQIFSVAAQMYVVSPETMYAVDLESSKVTPTPQPPPHIMGYSQLNRVDCNLIPVSERPPLASDDCFLGSNDTHIFISTVKNYSVATYPVFPLGQGLAIQTVVLDRGNYVVITKNKLLIFKASPPLAQHNYENEFQFQSNITESTNNACYQYLSACSDGSSLTLSCLAYAGVKQYANNFYSTTTYTGQFTLLHSQRNDISSSYYCSGEYSPSLVTFKDYTSSKMTFGKIGNQTFTPLAAVIPAEFREPIYSYDSKEFLLAGQAGVYSIPQDVSSVNMLNIADYTPADRCTKYKNDLLCMVYGTTELDSYVVQG